MNPRPVALRAAQWLCDGLPDASRFGLAERLADLRWRLAPKDRLAIQANLRLVLGEESTGHAAMIREVFRNFGRYLVEFFTIHRIPRPHVDVEGYEHLRDAYRAHRGAIILTGHVGTWEVGAVLIHRMGFPVTAVALPHEDRSTNQLFNRQRRRAGIDVVPVGQDAARQCLESLRRGRLVGLLGDWVFDGHGVAVPFCGREVVLPRGPAVLSQRGQAPIVPTFLTREGIWRFRLTFARPLWPGPAEPRERVVRTLMEGYAEVLERQIRRSPSQWLLFHRLGATD
jgi:KDO2-lipid IV(A) lauroyltransferase